MKKQIIWEPHYYKFDENKNTFSSSEDEEKSEYVENEEKEFNEEMNLDTIVQSPLGMFRLDDKMNPYRQFKLWMGHTNFDITPIIYNIIEKTPGIECLHILTRYRFLIAIGEVFSGLEVKNNIQTQLLDNSINSSLIEEKVSQLKEELKLYKEWIIYIFPNGYYEFSYLLDDLSNRSEFHKTVELLKEAEKVSHGKLLSHESRILSTEK